MRRSTTSTVMGKARYRAGAWGSTSGAFQASASKELATSPTKNTATDNRWLNMHAIDSGEKSLMLLGFYCCGKLEHDLTADANTNLRNGDMSIRIPIPRIIVTLRQRAAPTWRAVEIDAGSCDATIERPRMAEPTTGSMPVRTAWTRGSMARVRTDCQAADAPKASIAPTNRARIQENGRAMGAKERTADPQKMNISP
jgi:hypothetical protein